MVVEVMGDAAGWIALEAGIAGGAHMIALPEFPFDVNMFAKHIRTREKTEHQYHILVCAEGAYPVGGAPIRHPRTGKYGGVGEYLAEKLEELTGKEARVMAPGHTVRGGSPTPYDRNLGLCYGAEAVQAVVRGERGVMVATQNGSFVTMPIGEIAGKKRIVTTDTYEIQVAQHLGICFGTQMEKIR
jgi:ATP-dependent phosphofructokinase / diphosphate-dependent phosphofructokinase